MFTPVVVEIFLLFFTVYGFTLAQAHSSLFVWNNAVMLVGQMFFPAFIVTLSFYYSDLYDLRIVRRFSEFVKRLPRAFGIALVLLYSFYALFPLTGEKRPAFLLYVAYLRRSFCNLTSSLDALSSLENPLSF